jgi:hypothetical protein
LKTNPHKNVLNEKLVCFPFFFFQLLLKKQLGLFTSQTQQSKTFHANDFFEISLQFSFVSNKFPFAVPDGANGFHACGSFL